LKIVIVLLKMYKYVINTIGLNRKKHINKYMKKLSNSSKNRKRDNKKIKKIKKVTKVKSVRNSKKVKTAKKKLKSRVISKKNKITKKYKRVKSKTKKTVKKIDNNVNKSKIVKKMSKINRRVNKHKISSKKRVGKSRSIGKKTVKKNLKSKKKIESKEIGKKNSGKNNKIVRTAIEEQERTKRKEYLRNKRDMISLFSDAYARQVLIALGGENALEVIRSYPNGVSDEELSKKLKIKISDVRSTLNRMHGEGFVRYTRRKDSETGWYSYSWSINKKAIIEWVAKINDVKKKLYEDKTEKYYCKKCGLESLVGFTKAFDNEFKCQICNGKMDLLEKEKVDKLFEKMLPNQIIKNMKAKKI